MTMLPPPQYDVPPPMPVIEWVMTAAEVKLLCSTTTLGPGNWAGCTVPKDGKCYIVRIDDAEIARHERAHCAGWPKDHPGGWYDISAPGRRDR